MAHDERGVMLLEAMIALAILGIAGGSLAGLVATGVRAETRSTEREEAAWAQEQVLAGVTLLTRSELDARLGTRTLGAYEVLVSREGASLYRIRVSGPPEVAGPPLMTLVFRPTAR